MRADRSRLPDVGPDPAFTFPAIVRYTLPNGLQVRTVEHYSVPVVTLALLVDAGSGADPAHEEGLAAITADMLDEGTGSLSAIDISEALARLGAEYDVDAGADASLFTLTTLARFASRGAALMADMVTKPSLRAADFERVRQLRVDRLRQITDLPPAVADRAFLRVLYADHPYGHLAIGDATALRDLPLARVEAFHAAAFRPDRAILVAVGAMPHGALRDVAAEAFGSWTAQDGAPALGPPASALEPDKSPRARLSIVPREAAAQSELRIGHLSARRTTPDYPALLVMNAILGGQFVSRVNLKLREEKGYTYGARTGFDWHRGPAPFTLVASVHTAATADATRDALDELGGIRGSRPPTAEELTLAKASLTRGYPRGFETVQQVARAVVQLALYDLPDSYFEAFVPTVTAVTSADVTRVAQQYIDPSRLAVVIVGDHGALSDSLANLGLGAPHVLPVEV